MSSLDHAALLHHGYDTLAVGDAATVVAMFADNGVLHVNTDGPFGGDHQGHDAVAEILAVYSSGLAGRFGWRRKTYCRRHARHHRFMRRSHAPATEPPSM